MACSPFSLLPSPERVARLHRGFERRVSLSTRHTVYRRFLGFVDPGDWGWQCSLDVLVYHDRGADAQTLAETIDRYDPTANAQLYLEELMENPPQSEDDYRNEYGGYRY